MSGGVGEMVAMGGGGGGIGAGAPNSFRFRQRAPVSRFGNRKQQRRLMYHAFTQQYQLIWGVSYVLSG